MTRRQRRAHLLIWMIIGPLLIVGLGMAIALRPAPAVEAGSTTDSSLATSFDDGEER